MFKTSEEPDQDEYVIRHQPNRTILLIDRMKWYWPTLFLIVAFILFIIINPSSTDQSNAPTSLEGTIILVVVIISMVFLPFYIGVRSGANLYRPRESNLTKKQLKLFDQLLGKGENLKVEFIKKNGKVEILAKEEEV